MEETSLCYQNIPSFLPRSMLSFLMFSCILTFALALRLSRRPFGHGRQTLFFTLVQGSSRRRLHRLHLTSAKASETELLNSTHLQSVHVDSEDVSHSDFSVEYLHQFLQSFASNPIFSTDPDQPTAVCCLQVDEMIDFFLNSTKLWLTRFYVCCTVAQGVNNQHCVLKIIFK